MIVLRKPYLEKLTALIPELSKQSSQNAWDGFVRLTGDDLHKYICYYLNDQEFASDILQEVYLAFLKDSEGFCKICEKEPEEIASKKVYAWLYKTARNKSLNHLKKKRNASAVNSMLLDKAQQMKPDIQKNPLEMKETNDLVKYELSQLNERQQNLITLKFYLEKSNAEIAREIKCELASVQKLVDRALIQLKNRLEKSGIHLSIALISEELICKSMCQNMQPHVLLMAVQLYEASLPGGILTKTILIKGTIMKAFFTIAGATLIGTFFFFGKPKAENNHSLTQEKLSNNSIKNSVLLPVAERIVEKALEALSKSQDEDGSWKNTYGKNVGVNSLILLAFMSMGNYPEEGKYSEIVKKGVDWVLSQSKGSGLIQNLDEDGGGNAMYGHGFSTLMLSELWGHTKDAIVKEKLQKALELIIKVQGPKGSWGYYAAPIDGDTSVSATQMIALHSAKKAGMVIHEATLPKMIEILKKRFDTKNSMFGYGGPDNNIDSANTGTHAAGTCVMQISGEKDPTYTVDSLSRTFEIIEKYKTFNAYFIYYSSISAYQASSEKYKKWCDAIIPLIAAKQKENGEIDDHLSTAWSVISLSLPLNNIKVYQPE